MFIRWDLGASLGNQQRGTCGRGQVLIMAPSYGDTYGIVGERSASSRADGGPWFKSEQTFQLVTYEIYARGLQY